MRWLALHLPRLSLETLAATLPPEAAGRPLALLEGHRVADADAAARQRGVRPGQKRATALALVADLLVGSACARRDAQALQAVAHAVLAFTPSVTFEGGCRAEAATEPTVLMEVQASLRLFGGLPRLVQQVQAALAPLGHQLALACAPTPRAAALLARWQAQPGAPPAVAGAVAAAADAAGAAAAAHGAHAAHGAAATDAPAPLAGGLVLGPHTADLRALAARLADAPVWLLGPGREHEHTLQGMGLATLGDLCRLPRSGLARRFGEPLLDELDRALGRRPDPREMCVLPPVFDSRLELFARADHTEQVLHGAAVLLARLVAWAQGQFGRVAAFELRMHHELRHRAGAEPAPTHTALAVALAEPSCDAAHLQMLLRDRLARCPLPAPTLDLQLLCSRLHHAPPPNQELFATPETDREGIGRLLERLRARLGDAQVQQLVPQADHRPERSGRWVAAQAGTAGAVAAAAPAAAARGMRAGGPLKADGRAAPGPPAGARLPLHRPLWLLEEAQPLHERQSVPLLDGRPLHLLCGPERIEAGWWDGGLAARDYFIAQTDSGALVWIYRARLPAWPDGAADSASWYLHGRFA